LTFRPWTFWPLDVSPPGRFTPKTFCDQDVFPPGLFACRKFRPPPGRFAHLLLELFVSHPSVDFLAPLVSCNFRNVFSPLVDSHTCDKYWVAHPVFLSDVLNDVIGVTSNCRPWSIQLPYAIFPRLRFTTCVFSKAENWGRFYDPPGR